MNIIWDYESTEFAIHVALLHSGNFLLKVKSIVPALLLCSVESLLDQVANLDAFSEVGVQVDEVVEHAICEKSSND